MKLGYKRYSTTLKRSRSRNAWPKILSVKFKSCDNLPTLMGLWTFNVTFIFIFILFSIKYIVMALFFIHMQLAHCYSSPYCLYWGRLWFLAFLTWLLVIVCALCACVCACVCLFGWRVCRCVLIMLDEASVKLHFHMVSIQYFLAFQSY